MALCLLITPHLIVPDVIHISSLPKLVSIIGFNLLGLFALAVSLLLSPGQKNIKLIFCYNRSSLIIASVFAIYVLYTLTSLAWTVNQQLAIENLVKHTAGYFPLLLLGFLKIERREILLLMKCLSIGAASCAFIGLFQWLTGQVPDFVRIAPTWSFLNKNFTASYCCMALFPSLALWVLYGGTRSKWIWLLVTLLNSLLVFHSFARASWLGLAVGGVVFLALIVLSFSTSRFISAIKARYPEMLVFIGLFLLGTFINESRFEGRFSDFGQRIADTADISLDPDSSEPGDLDPGFTNSLAGKGSFAGRLLYWQNILVMIKNEFPLGVGEGNFQVHYPRYDSSVNPTNFNTKFKYLRYAHNEYLELLSELGLVGILLLPMILYVLTRSGIRVIQRCHTDITSNLIVISGLSAVVAIMLVCAASSALHWPLHNYALAVLFILAFHNFADEAATFRIEIPRYIMYGPILLCVLLIYSLLSYYTLRNRYEQDYQKSGFYYKRGEHQKGLELLKKAADMLPYDQLANQQYANVLCSRGEFEESLAYSSRVALYYPYDFRNNYNLGTAYLQTKQMLSAIPPFERCLEVVPSDKDVSLKLAVLLRNIDWQRSYGLIDSVIKNGKGDPKVHILKAENLMLQNKQGEAARVLIDAGKLFPGDQSLRAAFESFGFRMFSIE